MQCLKCGTENNTNAKFCRTCGNNLEAQRKAYLQEQERLAEERRRQFELWRKRTWGNKAVVRGVTAAVLLCLVGGGGYWYYQKKEKEKVNAENLQREEEARVMASAQAKVKATASTFVTNFYTWYLQGISSNNKFENSSQFKSAANNWLTPDFALNWMAIAEKTGVNPFILAQDYQNSWITNISPAVANQTATTSTVLVSLGIRPQLHNTIVHLVLLNGQWRIAAIERP